MQRTGDYGVLGAKWDLNIILFLPRLKGHFGKGGRKIRRAIRSENLQQYSVSQTLQVHCMHELTGAMTEGTKPAQDQGGQNPTTDGSEGQEVSPLLRNYLQL